MKRAITLAVGLTTAVAALLGPVSPASAATSTTVYDATESPLPGNVPSQAFEATQTSEFGDEVQLDGTARKKGTVTVTMSAWACQQGGWSTQDCSSSPNAKVQQPITLNIYEASTQQDDGTVVPGQRIAHLTKTFALKYRPSANFTKCTGTEAGEWFSKKDHTCYNGYAQNVSFKLGNVVLPDDVVLGVAFNTTHYGYSPIGESAACYGTSGGCFYDSLNVGLGTTGVHVGSKPHPDTVYQNTLYGPPNTCAGTALGVFNLDSPTDPCWGGYDPAFKITATGGAQQ